ncbi:MAG: signal recognition particle protein [Bacillota bacterium]|nr:signal recognition particle protein [Bacillota bacterium]
MAFENLTARLGDVFRRLRGKGKLTEADVNEALREVRVALLEADVNLKVARDLIARVRERAVGEEVMASLTPAQTVLKIVYEEMTRLLGGRASRLDLGGSPPMPVMLVGLHGSGKTTTGGKLAFTLRRQGRFPLLVATDVYRPAAPRQLEVVADRAGVPFFFQDGASPVVIARRGLERARETGRDVVIIDTAGRLQVDAELMAELEEMKAAVTPRECLLVVDAMTGQEAVNVAQAFHERLGLTGVILTKLDGDARGGAALSVQAVTGCPVKLAGMGEKLDALEPFHPDRMASRILGMGDLASLVERAEAALEVEKARELEKKIRTMEFTLEDYLEQLKQVRKMGPLDQLLSLIPGLGRAVPQVQVDEKGLVRTEAIICSMTRGERRNPALIGASRKRRIAAGSGTSVQEVNRVLKGYEQARRLLKQLPDMEKTMRKGGGRLWQ